MLGEGTAKVMETWPDEPPRIREEHFDPFLLWCVGKRASDINIQSDQPVFAEIDNELHPVLRRPIDAADMASILTKVYGPEALAKLAGGRDLDVSYEVRTDRYTRYRFRVNITAILSRGRDSVQVTMRSLPNKPPTMQDLNIEQEVIDSWAPRQGLVLVTGPTGSGKSTLLAAGNRMLIERGCGKMLTYEAPIEYVYDDIEANHSLVAQSEIPRHLPSFADGVRNALRRKPNIILVGESRDKETVSAAIEAGQTGHAVYSTVHTTGVAATVRRMMAVFPANERTERAFAMMETLRLVVTQALVPKIGGGRIGVREWLRFDDDIRERMLDTEPDTWTGALQKIVPQRGRTMENSARRIFEKGIIDKRWYKVLANSTGGGE